MNHTQRIVHVARQRRYLTQAIVREAVERYLEALAADIAHGGWVDIPGIGKMEVSREEGKGFVTTFGTRGQRIRRQVRLRLRTKFRLSKRFKAKCRSGL